MDQKIFAEKGGPEGPASRAAGRPLDLLGDGRKGMRWTNHCKQVCETRGTDLVNHCREKCLVGQQCKNLAKSRWAPEQSVVAKDHILEDSPVCGTAARCGAAPSLVVSTTQLIGLTPLLVLSLRFDSGGLPPLFIKLTSLIS